MNTQVTGYWFDGLKLTAHPATLECDGFIVRLTGLETSFETSLAHVSVSDRLGRTPRYLHFPGGGSFETLDNDGIDQLLGAERSDRISLLIHWLEARSRIAAIATLLLVAIVGASTYFGVPVLCRRAALAVPANIERSAGEAALGTLNQWLKPSDLDHTQRRRVLAQLTRLRNASHFATAPRLEYRRLGTFPNAFAFPGGIIVMSDELVLLATDDEIAAVLAHEIAHWQLRHGLQSVFRSSAALLVVTTITGDLSTLTSFAGTIPLTLLQRGYSREFEQDADDYAVQLLKRAQIDTRALASILSKLEKSRPGSGADYSYLSTHPATSERIKRIDPTGTYRELLKPEEPASTEEAKGSPSTDSKPPNPDSQSTKVESLNLVTDADEPPSPLSQTPPTYPLWERVKGNAGTVTLEFVVMKDGTVHNVVAVESSHQAFSDAAIAAVQQWKFSPGKKAGKPVNTRASITIPFTLTQE